MTTLLTFRDNIKAFVSRYDYIFTPIGKGILAFIIFYSLNSQLGYLSVLGKPFLLLLQEYLPFSSYYIRLRLRWMLRC